MIFFCVGDSFFWFLSGEFGSNFIKKKVSVVIKNNVKVMYMKCFNI